eukprot:TRINITY_DN3302_c0_g1_i1.p1 TRINITY_DN3302_c0_g1~~TRINITY_DN3302_c0_g1_i1.p1  ORF type:complete len:737 (+),score=227.14 TRINITY_DN3302_c0_g1_i1:143-2353(+)
MKLKDPSNIVIGRSSRKRTRSNNSIFTYLCICLCLVLIWIIFFSLYSIFFTSPEKQTHLQHEIEAKLGTVFDWLSSYYDAGCSSPLPDKLEFINLMPIKNDDFSDGLEGWKIEQGRPETRKQKEKKIVTVKGENGEEENKEIFVENNFFIGGDAEYNRTFSCISQEVDLSDVLEPNILSEVNFNTLIVQMYAKIRRPPRYQHDNNHLLHKCGYKNHFCDPSYNDHVWFELQFLRERSIANSFASTDKRRQYDTEVISKISSVTAGHDRWQFYKLLGTIPPDTERIKIEICSQEKGGGSQADTHQLFSKKPRHTQQNKKKLDEIYDNDGMLDEVKLGIFHIPEKFRQHDKHYKCTITKLPMLRYTTPAVTDEITIIWETDSYLNFQQIHWGWDQYDLPYDKNIIHTTQVSACNYVHKAVVQFKDVDKPMLPISQQRHTLYYQISCGDTMTEVFSYKIPAPLNSEYDDGNFRVAVISDNQYGAEELRHIILHLEQMNADFMLMGGDYVDNGKELSQFNKYLWQPLSIQNFVQSIPTIIAHGNHDGESSYAYAYTGHPSPQDFNQPEYFSFYYEGSHFITLNSNCDSKICPHQTKWLIETLSSQKSLDARFRLVMFHLPPFTELWDPREGYNGEEFVQTEWVPLFEKYNVDIVISGHTHAYSRFINNNVIYTIVGGAGGMIDREYSFDWGFENKKNILEHHFVLIQFNNCALYWNVYDKSNDVIDSVIIPSKSSKYGCK